MFHESNNLGISFDLITGQNRYGRLEIELLTNNGESPIKIWFADDGYIYNIDGEMTTPIQKYNSSEWMKFDIKIKKLI